MDVHSWPAYATAVGIAKVACDSNLYDDLKHMRFFSALAWSDKKDKEASCK